MATTYRDDALFFLLDNHAALTALVEDRIYPDILPEGVEFPAVTYTQEPDIPEYSHSGDSNLSMATYQINVWDDTSRLTCVQVASVINTLLGGFKGAVDGYEFQVIQVVNRGSDTIDPDTDWKRRRIEVRIWDNPNQLI